MAIDAACTFCAKPYRLKDELLGKKVTCANQDCRKVFTVAPVAAKLVAAPADADALAVAALVAADKEMEASTEEDLRIIAMTCTMCEHHWSAPWAMQGKNVLCPECKHRQKVPIPKDRSKPADWRSGGGGPSMAKTEELAGVSSSRGGSLISGQTMKDAGLLAPEFEDRPKSFYVKIGVVLVAALLLLSGGLYYRSLSKTARSHDQAVEDFAKHADAEELAGLAPETAPLYRAILRMAGGEFAARLKDPKQLDRALELFTAARGDLAAAKKTPERDELLGELALLSLLVGGDDAEVVQKVRIPWLPQAPKTGRATIRQNQAEAEGVQGQFRRVLETLQKGNADFDNRAAVVRRVARVLEKKGQLDVLRSSLQAGFTEAEQPEILGQIGIEVYRSGNKEPAKALADELASQLSNSPPTNPTPISAFALWLAFDMKGTGLPPAPSGGVVTDATRMTYTALEMLKNNPAEAEKIAARPGPPDPRIRALALAAEWADEPGPFLDEALKVLDAVAKAKDPNVGVSQVALLRLAQAAAGHGAGEKAETLMKAINDPGLRAWAAAEVLRGRMAADRNAVLDEAATVPAEADARKYAAGHAWGRYLLARHNALATGDRGLAKKYLADWTKTFIAPFGLAGASLGMQDRDLK